MQGRGDLGLSRAYGHASVARANSGRHIGDVRVAGADRHASGLERRRCRAQRFQEARDAHLHGRIVRYGDARHAGGNRIGHALQPAQHRVAGLPSARGNALRQHVQRRRDVDDDEIAQLARQRGSNAARAVGDDMPAARQFIQQAGRQPIAQAMRRPGDQEGVGRLARRELGLRHALVVLARRARWPGDDAPGKHIARIGQQRRPGAVHQRVLARAAGANHEEESAGSLHGPIRRGGDRYQSRWPGAVQIAGVFQAACACVVPGLGVFHGHPLLSLRPISSTVPRTSSGNMLRYRSTKAMLAPDETLSR